MIKFRDVGTYKVATNIPYCKATVPMKNGMVVTANLVTKTSALPTADTAKGDVYLVMNRIDKPEIKSPNEYTIEVGEFPRLFDVKNLRGRILDMDTSEVATAFATIAVGDKLTAGTDGKLVVNATVTGYDVCFEVIEKTTFGGEGIAVKVIA